VGNSRQRGLVGGGLVLFVALLFLAGTPVAVGQEKEPVYVGVRVCSECHDAPGAGHQFSVWRLSKHAKAHATLTLPESEEIARRSGIPEPPLEARVCLGCHTTGADAEEWRRDETFLIEDGVQCETCHGPGSEYIDSDVMRNRELAMERGLVMPTRQSCMICHGPKGSHEAVLEPSPWEYETARAIIAHPRPAQPVGDPSNSVQSRWSEQSAHRFAGVTACGACHAGAEMGFQSSRWRMGPHAGAYARLATPPAREMAAAAGVDDDPQERIECLRCHATGAGFSAESFAPGFDIREGVQCESCHGPGADYLSETVMLDPVAARQAGLQEPTAEVCTGCHEPAHGKPFDIDAAMIEIDHPKNPVLVGVSGEPEYKTPINIALSPDGQELWIACEASSSTIVVDTGSRTKVAEIPVGGQPHDVAFSPDGRRAYVTNRLDDSLSVIDVDSRQVVRTIPVGDEPHGVLTDKEGRTLYVLNSGLGSISVIDTQTLEEVKRLTASRLPWSLALSPDGKKLVVTNTLSRFVEPRTELMSELTLIDTERGVVEDRRVARGTNLLQGVAWHPSGDYAVFTLNRTKNLVPMTRLLQGWTVTNGMGLVWRDGRVDQVLLDQPDLAFPDAADIAVTPDGRHALVTSTGSDRLAVVDLEKLVAMLAEASPQERERVFPNHLGKPVEFVNAYIPTGISPRGVTISGDGGTAYVANTLDDSITVVDLNRLEAVERIDLGGPAEITKTRLGERLFHSANIAFRRQFSCHTCHPDGHVDGITYDIEPDGIGVNPVDNRTLRGIFDTAPFKWTGLNPNLQRQCGPRLAVFFTRIDPFTPEELEAVELYITTIPRPPNRYRALGAPLTEAQRQGKALFERSVTNDGRPIPSTGRCISCHPGPLYTDRQKHDVGTKSPLDTEGIFDTPHLTNIYDSAPYLHDGTAESLEEIWTRFNPDDRHGVTNDMTKDELNHLIEYIKTL
jgi:YVTN family beta-propeller protein